jgi:error-prone DNA polymerase
LMVVHGVVQHDEAVVHVIASRLEDDTAMLRHLSEDAMPHVLSRGDGGGAMVPLPNQAPPMVHPRNVQCLPKSRDFH